MPVDYAALADQARKQSAPVDYAALAEQARNGGTPAQNTQLAKNDKMIADRQQTPDAGFWNTLGDAVKNGPKSLMDFISGHPMQQMSEHGKEMGDAAKEAFKKGDYSSAFGLGLASMLPGTGDVSVAAGNAFGEGKIREGLAHTALAVGPVVGPELAGKAMGMAPDVASAAGDAARGAAEGTVDVLRGAAKSPGVAKMAAGTGQVVSAPVALASGHPIVAGGLVLRGASNIGKGIADKIAAIREGQAPTGAGYLQTAGTIQDPGFNPNAAAEAIQAQKVATFDQAAQQIPPEVMAELTKDSVPTGAPPSAPTVQPEPAQAAPIVQPVTAAPPAPVQPRALLEAPPQAIQLPAAADTSYVKSVPAQYPEVEAPPVSPQAEPALAPKASPQRVVEIKANNMDAKAQRFAEALDAAGITGDLRKIPAGRYSSTQIQKGATPGWANILDDLVHKKLLPEGETVPNTSIPAIIAKFKKIQADKIAKELADEAKRSGTIQ